MSGLSTNECDSHSFELSGLVILNEPDVLLRFPLTVRSPLTVTGPLKTPAFPPATTFASSAVPVGELLAAATPMPLPVAAEEFPTAPTPPGATACPYIP